MNIEKALKIIDAGIENKQKKKKDLLDLNMSWNKGDGNVFDSTAYIFNLVKLRIISFNTTKKFN